jgi:hypothetical protein
MINTKLWREKSFVLCLSESITRSTLPVWVAHREEGKLWDQAAQVCIQLSSLCLHHLVTIKWGNNSSWLSVSL